MIVLSGNVTKVGGGAANQVVIRDATTRQLAAIATPVINGDWTADVYSGTYDITYFATGCQPICHGPYTVGSQ